MKFVVRKANCLGDSRIWFFFSLLLTSCHLGPRYDSPSPSLPSAWKAPANQEKALESQEWWDVFQDEELTKLQRQTIEKNLDLAQALQRVVAARATAGVAQSSLAPQVSLNPIYNNLSELIELYGVPQGLFPGLKTITRVHEFIYQLPVSMSYEVDLWGKLRGTYNAAKIYAEAQDEALLATMLTVTADVASNYFNLRALDTQIEMLRSTFEMKQRIRELIQARFSSGLVNVMDLIQAEKQVSDADAELQDFVRQRSVFENAIAVLVDLPASEFHIEPRSLYGEPPSIPAGVPSNVLLRRPDIAQAERNMASFHEWIGVAYATYFPSVTLTSALGFSSPDLSQFLTWTSRLWQIGANIAQMLFNGGRNHAYVNLASAKFQETKAAYEKAVLVALQEVEDALNDVEQQNKQCRALTLSYEAAKANAFLAELRFEKGVANSLDVLNNKLVEIQANRMKMNILGQRYQSLIQLIKALGGGWGDVFPSNEHPE